MDVEAPRLRELALSDSGFVFDPLTGHTFTVNPSGLFILRLLKDGVAEAEVAAKLVEAFDIEAGEDPLRDLQDFILQLRDCGLSK